MLPYIYEVSKMEYYHQHLPKYTCKLVYNIKFKTSINAIFYY